MQYQTVLSDVADDAVRAAIGAPLRAYNESQMGGRDYLPLVISVMNEAGEIEGGLWGHTCFGWLYTQLLAAPSEALGQGLGKRLMEEAEAEARARGCIGAWVDTHSFQAPEFYEKLGYQRFAELSDYPPGHSRIFYSKRLDGKAELDAAPRLLQGERLRLRASALSDAETFYPWARDERVMRYMEWPMPQSIAETRAFFRGNAERWREGDCHWMIEDAASGLAYGSLGCRIAGHQADFGYLLAPEAWGRGIATEASALLLEWLRGRPEIERICATTDIDNLSSQRVLERLGLSREGVLRKAKRRPQLGNAARDAAIYGWARE
ncbi:GNAT family N-acetyltransferase [Chromobacterium sp. IIBBL 290-4]|uniref:GNAT family N-acetyltransferase n=1 Tax=Chromobacterium sp. IIBBL 290-4 TaxID=2953890 RepID=UPI0020B6F782|nr:GNAT family N-acetyltransferase [Chromobacterium sp. IIBBL 290-4]UTH74685.1 GNAT family N-acetyltransferase [Chromobacterium sp. IIBBL 290-4]